MSSSSAEGSGRTLARIRYNAGDPTDSAEIRGSFQAQLQTKWNQVETRVEEWFDGADDIDYNRIHLKFRTFFHNTAFSTVLQQSSDADVSNGRHWTANYIRDAYQQGLRLAEQDLRAFGGQAYRINQSTRYFADVHQDHLTREYQAAYVGLADSIHRTVDEVSTVLRDGIREEWDAEAFRDSVIDVIDSTARNSAKSHANTVTVETVNEAALTAFESYGVEHLGAITESAGSANVTNTLEIRTHDEGDPETYSEVVREELPSGDDPRDPTEVQFVTAGDENVCTQCRAIEGTVLKISDVRETPAIKPPIHPNCRCRLVPLDPDVSAS